MPVETFESSAAKLLDGAGPLTIIVYGRNDGPDLRLAQSGPAYYHVLWELMKFLRTALKHGHPYTSADAALEATQKQVIQLLSDEGVSLDDIP